MVLGRRELVLKSLGIPAGVRIGSAEDEILRAVTGRGRALLIGSSAYEAKTGWARLPGVSRNIDLLAAHLAPHFDRVIVRRDLKLSELHKTLEDFLLSPGVRTDDRLFLFYAGHGFYNMLGDRQNGYITAVDTLSPVEHPHAYRTGLPMPEVNSMVERSIAKHVFCVFDSCYSGSVVSPSPSYTHNFPKAQRFATRSRIFLSSGQYTEKIPEPSPVATLLLEGISGAADRDGDGLISAFELGAYVNRRVNQLYSNSATPFAPRFGRLQGSDHGDFFFAGRLSPPPPPVNRGTILRVPFDLPERPPTARTYLVFFDWNRALMSPRGHEIAWQASMNALDLLGQEKLRRIEIRAHSSQEISPAQAQRLTDLRADIVNLAVKGFEIPKELVAARGFGLTAPLVPTANGVNEPQNRRVELIIHA